jgi:hypothetical protein
MLFAFLADAATQLQQARATVRIMPAVRVSYQEWKSAPRRREIMLEENGRRMIVRLVEIE